MIAPVQLSKLTKVGACAFVCDCSLSVDCSSIFHVHARHPRTQLPPSTTLTNLLLSPFNSCLRELAVYLAG